MRHVNLKASRTLKKLIDLADANDGYFKLENSTTFMPLVIENIGPNTYSFAHYYEKNSDLMRDPEVVMWHSPSTQRLYPVAFRQDPYLNAEYAHIEADGMPTCYYRRAQKDLAVFCGHWVRNIKSQQNI